MATITSTASLASVYYVSWLDWNNVGDYAHQGEYGGGYSRVGIMNFSSLGTTLKGKIIKSITFEPTIGGGTNGASRTLTFYSSNYQTISTSYTGASYPNAKLGVLVGNGTTGTSIASTYPGKQKFVLNSSTNSSLFNAWAARLIAGDTTFLLYNGETSNASGYNYSANYLNFSAASLTVEYESHYTITVGHYLKTLEGGLEALTQETITVTPGASYTPTVQTPPDTHMTDGVTYNAWSWDWSERLVANGTPGVNRVTVNQDIRVEVYYPLHTYTLNISQGIGSTISVKRSGSTLSDGATITYGDVLIITFSADSGYELETHTVNGDTFTSGYTHTVTDDVVVVSTAKMLGFVRIYNGSRFVTYLVYIDNGTDWVQCIPYVDNGSSWNICS